MGVGLEARYDGVGVELGPEGDVASGGGGSGEGCGEGVVVWSEGVGGVDSGEEFEGLRILVCACEVCEFVVQSQESFVGKGTLLHHLSFLFSHWFWKGQ